MVGTQVSVEIQRSTADRFDKARDDFDTMLKQLLSRLEGLQGAWVGAGGRSFNETKLRWAEDQSALLTMLSQTAQLIRESGNLYATTDNEAGARMAAPGSAGPVLPL
ncbi:MAG: WXG100 family type VII secretion target [Micromonosporaceae bacterium]|nr:WXG100 family type VII secretion target [Micromonosporaceae bacterium]